MRITDAKGTRLLTNRSSVLQQAQHERFRTTTVRSRNLMELDTLSQLDCRKIAEDFRDDLEATKHRTFGSLLIGPRAVLIRQADFFGSLRMLKEALGSDPEVPILVSNLEDVQSANEEYVKAVSLAPGIGLRAISQRRQLIEATAFIDHATDVARGQIPAI